MPGTKYAVSSLQHIFRDVLNSDFQYSTKYKYSDFLSGWIQIQILNCH